LANVGNSSKSKNYANKKYIRDYRHFDKKYFLDDLKEQLTVFIDLKVSTPSEREDHFFKFVTVVLSSINKHAPWKHASRKNANYYKNLG